MAEAANKYHLVAIPADPAKAEAHFRSGQAAELLATYERFYREVGHHPPWLGYFIVQGKEVLGTCGFTGAPTEGRVELAYWTFPGNEGKGIATWACGAMVRLARAVDRSLTLTAKTEPQENASTRILRKHGFQQAGMVQDHEIGDAWLWELLPV